MKKEKVYCSECTYFTKVRLSYKDSSGYDFYNHKIVEECHAPQNAYKYDSYYARHIEYVRAPHKINRRNTCKWFKELAYNSLA